MAYRFHESLVVFTTTVGILQGDRVQQTACTAHHPEVADLLLLQEVALKICRDIYIFIGHCVLQNGRRHRTLSSRRHPFYGPHCHVNADLVERYTRHYRVGGVGRSAAMLCRFRCQLCTLCNFLEISFIKIGTVEMARLSRFTCWHSSWILLGGVRRLLFLT